MMVSHTKILNASAAHASVQQSALSYQSGRGLFWFYAVLLSLMLWGSSVARAQPIASNEVVGWSENCAMANSSFKWTDLGYPWLRIDWGFKSVNTAQLDALPAPCSAVTAQALRLLSDAVVVIERELAQGHGPTVAAFYQYWNCAEEDALVLAASARAGLPDALVDRPDPELARADWLGWMWALLTESAPWRC